MALNWCQRKCASTPVSDGMCSTSRFFHRTACAVPLLIQRQSGLELDRLDFSPDGLRRSAFNSMLIGVRAR